MKRISQVWRVKYELFLIYFPPLILHSLSHFSDDLLYISGHDFDQSKNCFKWIIWLLNCIHISNDKTPKSIELRIPNNKKFHTCWYIKVFVPKSNLESLNPTVIEINKSCNINVICKKKNNNNKNTTASVRKK